MPGIARSLRQARSWSRAVQVHRVRARPRARRARARSRVRRPDRRTASSAGAVPASAAGAGRSRRPRSTPSGSTQRRPSAGHHAPLDRGRPLVLDQLLADRPGQRLERLRATTHPQPGTPAQRAPRSADRAGSAGETAPQVLVDAERESHPRDAVGRGRVGSCARAEQDPVAARSGRRARPRAARRGAAAVRAPLRDGAARRPCPTAASGEKGRPGRTSSRSSTTSLRRPLKPRRPPALSRVRRAGARPRAASGCPRSGPARRPSRRACRAKRPAREPRPGDATSPTERGQLALAAVLTRPTTAAPATNPPAATAAACTAGMAGARRSPVGRGRGLAAR